MRHWGSFASHRIAGHPNERVLYELPADRSRLIMLLRAGTHGNEHLLASNCKLAGAAPRPAPTNETMHFCRPGTGLFNAGLPGDKMPWAPTAAQRQRAGGSTGGTGPWPGYHPVPVGHSCNWTAPYFTTIPDSHSRACTAPLPDGRIFMIGVRPPRLAVTCRPQLLPPIGDRGTMMPPANHQMVPAVGGGGSCDHVQG